MIRFSVVIPTRNRPELFDQALASVLVQTEADIEVIVVNDGSDPAHDAAYAAIAVRAGPRARFLGLPRRAGGHGPAHAANTGVEAAQGAYVGFLDDDDVWTDPTHLHRAGRAIELAGELDLFLSDQVAWHDGEPQPGPVWIEDLPRVGDLQVADAAGSHRVTAAILLRATGFCHLNTLIVRRAFFLELSGFDEGLRYEQDRDFYLRAIDRARTIRYAPFKVARHNVPVAASGANMSTIVSTAEKRLYQLRLLDRLILSAVRPEIRRYATRHKAYALQRLAEELTAAGSHATATRYAVQALAVRPSAASLASALANGVRACAGALASGAGSSRH